MTTGRTRIVITPSGGIRIILDAFFWNNLSIGLEKEDGEPIISRFSAGAIAKISCRRCFAGVAQLVEHDVANVVVVGSNPITRSL